MEWLIFGVVLYTNGNIEFKGIAIETAIALNVVEFFPNAIDDLTRRQLTPQKEMPNIMA